MVAPHPNNLLCLYLVYFPIDIPPFVFPQICGVFDFLVLLVCPELRDMHMAGILPLNKAPLAHANPEFDFLEIFVHLRFLLRCGVIVKVVGCSLLIEGVVVGLPVFQDLLVLDKVVDKFFLVETVRLFLGRDY